jgi:centrin-1
LYIYIYIYRFDVDGSGSISPQELKVAMQSLGFESKNQTIFEIVSALDKDRSGDISFEEFTELMVSSSSKADTREDILHVFNLFDTDGSGKITFEDLKRVAEELGEEITDEELKNMITRADTK